MSVGLIKKNKIKNKNFFALFTTQFLGALNDNILKNALVVLITYKGVTLWGFDTHSIVALAGGIFIAPFFLFSSIAGQLSDKYEKSKIIRLVKWFEVLIMAIAGYGFFTHHFSLLMFALFLMGLHSTFFGPIKYSIIPELVPENQLTSANAFIEIGTFLAILIGTILGGVSAGIPSGEKYIVITLISVAILGLISSYMVPAVPIADGSLRIGLNPLSQIWSTILLTRPVKAVFNSILGISWFWFYGAAILSILPVLTKDLLGGNEAVVTLFLATFTIGIALGAFLCERLSYERVEIGLVPWGSLGMTIFLADLAWVASTWVATTSSVAATSASDLPQLLTLNIFLAQPQALRIIFDLFMVAISGGVFTVPLYTLIQERSDRRIRSQVIASNNIMGALFMVTSSVLLMIFYSLKMTIPQILLSYAAMNLIASFYIYSIVPEFTLRFLSWVLARMIYRIRTSGLNNIPKEGAAVLVCNHVSFVDWLIIAAAIKRPVRFVMYYKFFKIPLIRYLFRHARVIPIAGQQEDPVLFNKAFEIVSSELRAGELVCIFPEGGITSDGEVKEFKRGIEHIVKRDAVPVIPLAIDGLWGSIFSRKWGRALKLKRLPRRIWFFVDVIIDKPIPAHIATAPALEKKVRELLS